MKKKLRYNLVVLENETDWLKYCLSDLKRINDIKLVESRFPVDRMFISKILCIHFSKRINRYINIPFKWMWNRLITKNICKDRNKKIVIIMYDWNILANNARFLVYLRKYYKKVFIIYIFTNVVSHSGAMQNRFVEKLDTYFDIIYAFDPRDSLKYGFNYTPLLYSRCNNVNIVNRGVEVFYVGEAKDRLDILHNVFERLKSLEITNKFFINKVDNTKQIYRDEIVYNHTLTYGECLENICGANCLLDIIQGDSHGYTIKTCEAVFYDKLLITNNKDIKNAPFYRRDYIMIINDVKDIDKAFFENPQRVHYSREDKAYFSAETFLKHLERDLGLI